MALLIFMDYAPGIDLLHTGLQQSLQRLESGEARNMGAGGAPGCDPGREPLRHCPAGWGARWAPRAPSSAPHESRAGALIWWRGLLLAKLTGNLSHGHQTVRIALRALPWESRSDKQGGQQIKRKFGIVSIATPANSANCYRLPGHFIRPGCQFKFSHKNVYFN